MLAPKVPPPFPLQWGFTTRLDALENAPPIRLKQIHGNDIHPATSAVQPGDGLWTTTPGETIGVRVADCAPILLAGIAADTPWVAALHAGWRGAVAGILRRGVALFQEQGGNPEVLVWAIGPAIGRCHFEVGAEVIQAARMDPAWREDLATVTPSGKFFFDLHGFLHAQAMDLGLDARRDGSIHRCTRCEPELFFSYRGGDLEGRQWGWIRIGEKI